MRVFVDERKVVMNEERTIDLRELVKYVVLKWRMILIFMIVFAVLANGYSGIKSYLNIQELKEKEQTLDYTQYESRLTVKEIQEVKNAVENYNLYSKKYSDYKNYNDNSIKMKIDATEAPTQEIIYEIRGNRNDVTNISDAYTTVFPNDDTCEEILKAMNWDVDVSYIKELISVSDTHMNTIAVGGQDVSEIIENTVDENKAVLITIKVLANNEENCKIMSDIIKKSLNTVTLNLQKKFGNFSIQKISDEYGTEVNGDLLDAQKNSISEMNNCNNAMSILDDVLSEDQKTYFNALINENISSEEESESKDVATVTDTVPGVQYINIKYIVAGVVLGFFVACFYAICRFFLNNHLVSKSYIVDDLKYPLLGVFSNNSKEHYNKIDQLLRKMFYKSSNINSIEEQLQMMCTTVKVIMQKNNMERIYVTSTMKSKDINMVLQKFAQKLDKNEIKYSIGEPILYSAKSLEEFSKTDGVIFVEQINKSLMRDINREVEECKKYDIKNLGFVLIEN